MDRIVKTADGYDCIVDGRRFGTWRSRAEATAGMVTERRRAAEREEAESARQIAYADAETQRHHEWRNRE